MKKVLKQKLSAVLCLLFIVCTVLGGISQNEIEVQAAGDFVIDANNCLTKYKGSGGDVIIPDTVTKIGDWAFEDCSGLTSVVIPSSVKSIGESMSST